LKNYGNAPIELRLTEPALTKEAQGMARGVGPRYVSYTSSNVVTNGNEYLFRWETDAYEVRTIAEEAARNGATEINIFTNAHGGVLTDGVDAAGIPDGTGNPAGFILIDRNAGYRVNRTNPKSAYITFFSEDAKTQGMIQADYEKATVNLFDATDPVHYDTYQAKAALARALEPGVVCIGGACFSAYTRHDVFSPIKP